MFSVMCESAGTVEINMIPVFKELMLVGKREV